MNVLKQESSVRLSGLSLEEQVCAILRRHPELTRAELREWLRVSHRRLDPLLEELAGRGTLDRVHAPIGRVRNRYVWRLRRDRPRDGRLPVVYSLLRQAAAELDAARAAHRGPERATLSAALGAIYEAEDAVRGIADRLRIGEPAD